MKFSSINLRYLALPLIAIPVAVIATIMVIRNGYDQVNQQIEKLKDVQKDERVLSEKLSILKKIQSGVLEKTNVSVIALQEKNPSSYTLSLIRKYLQDQSIPLESIDVKSGRNEGEEISYARLNIRSGEMEGGSVSSVINFLNSLAGSIPLTNLSEVRIEESSEKLTFEVDGSTYWSEFPTELPPLTQPIKDLSSRENDLLGEVASLFKPSFSTLDPLDPNPNRGNPFY